MDILFYLLAGHMLADFALQSDAMAKGKNRNNKTIPPPGAKYTPCWGYWLTAHSGVHALMVALATGSWVLGACEWVIHWVIDFLKCENKFGVHVDQALHIGCKITWFLFIVIET